MKHLRYSPALLITLILISGCHSNKNSRQYAATIDSLRQEHLQNLKSEHGWLSLAGLYWLHEGDNSFGSDSSNDLIFPPQAPPQIGTFHLHHGAVRVTILPGVKVTVDGKEVYDTLMIPDTASAPTVLRHQSLSWWVIQRSEQTGIRLRDLASANIDLVNTLPGWPADMSWRLEARFVPFTAPIEVNVPNVLGTTYKDHSPGLLYFTYKEKQYSLQPTGTPDHLFVVFADATSGKESYIGGRFLEVDGPDNEGNYFIDFNKAYNPPCAFTPFATCPVPFKNNILPFAVTAGEKTDPAWHGHQ